MLRNGILIMALMAMTTAVTVGQGPIVTQDPTLSVDQRYNDEDPWMPADGAVCGSYNIRWSVDLGSWSSCQIVSVTLFAPPVAGGTAGMNQTFVGGTGTTLIGQSLVGHSILAIITVKCPSVQEPGGSTYHTFAYLLPVEDH